MKAIARLHAATDESRRTGEPVGEILERRAATRREFLAAGGVAAAGAAVALHPLGAVASAVAAKNKPRVAVVGAGLAGLSCTRVLARHGLQAALFEGNPERIGGRCWSLRGYFGGGITVEHGGAFIDTNQHAVRRIAKELGLQEEEIDGGGLPGLEEVFFDSEGLYTHPQATSDWEQVGYAAFRAAAKQASTEAGKAQLDSLSVPEWLDQTPIGATSRLGRLMQSSCVSEFGADPVLQSSLDLLELLEGNPRRKLGILSGVDERFHIHGGNDQLVAGLAAELAAGTIQMGRRLVGIRRTPGGAPVLVFEEGNGLAEATFDLVVLALPFTMLRETDLAQSGLSATKRNVIATLGMGTNAKVHLEVTHKTWAALGYSGSTYGEPHGMCCGWDDCVQLGPSAQPAVFCAFPGGTRGATGLTGTAHGPAPAADVAWALSEVEQAFPGTTAATKGPHGEPLQAYEDHWALDPWVKGAYSYDMVGQAATYAQLAAASDGPFFFAGEHTADENQGYLDGAVETGERAAHEVLRRV